MAVPTHHAHLGHTARRGALLVLVMLSACIIGEGAAQSARCPVDCDSAVDWCGDTFGRGGNVTLASCSTEYISCTCNAKSSIVVDVGSTTGGSALQCAWDSVFEPGPPGQLCFPYTNTCPSDGCRSITKDTWAAECFTNVACEDFPNSSFSFSCSTCSGRLYSVVGNATDCSKSYSSTILCDPAKTCSGNGCCTPPSDDLGYPICTCFNDSTRGFWDGPSCSQCAAGYDSSRGNPCTNPTPHIQYVLSSIASTWTMMMPNLAVMFLFVILGVSRSLWDSDSAFTLTGLRRANLSYVQVARRNQHGLFHSKYIPKRPAASRSFVNPQQVKQRGPPAY